MKVSDLEKLDASDFKAIAGLDGMSSFVALLFIHDDDTLRAMRARLDKWWGECETGEQSRFYAATIELIQKQLEDNKEQ